MHRKIEPIQRNSWRVHNDTNSRERDTTLVRHCLAQDSEKRKKRVRQEQYTLSRVERETLGRWHVD